MAAFLLQLKKWGVPGYRSGTPWKQVVATITYLVLAAWLVQGFTGRPGLAAFSLALLAAVFVGSNAWKIRSKLPLLSAPSRAKALAGWGVLVVALLITGTWSLAETTPTAPAGASSLRSGSGGVGGGAPATAPSRDSSPTPTRTATPKPTPTPTPAPATPAPVQATQPPLVVSVTFVNAPLTARPGQRATLNVRTAPNTGCTIEVDYKSGASTAQGLGPKTSDGAGNVTWTWMVGTRTTPGQWSIYVTCGDATNQTYINVT